MNTIIAVQDPWQDYDAAAKKKPIVPEPAFFGVVFFSLIMAMVWLHRRKK